MDTDTLRLMIVDDHAVVRLGLRNLLMRQPGWDVIADVGTVAEALRLADELEPDLILMDAHLGDGSGIEACREIVQSHPRISIIILTAFAEDELLLDAISAGAVGYVLKDLRNEDLIRAIETVAQGEILLDPDAPEQALADIHELTRPEAFAMLTDQELRVLALIAQGQTNKEIAENLHLSEGTVRNYVSTILGKLAVANRAEATAYAVQHRLDDYLDPPT